MAIILDGYNGYIIKIYIEGITWRDSQETAGPQAFGGLSVHHHLAV
jgi:hypothetical protein